LLHIHHARTNDPTAKRFLDHDGALLVPPGQTIQRPAPPDWLRTYVEPEPVQIEFLDSAGRRWSRDEQGTLSRSD
ncbi:hypothetical protein, partial [Paractinoplanes hotanensis]